MTATGLPKSSVRPELCETLASPPSTERILIVSGLVALSESARFRPEMVTDCQPSSSMMPASDAMSPPASGTALSIGI